MLVDLKWGKGLPLASLGLSDTETWSFEVQPDCTLEDLKNVLLQMCDGVFRVDQLRLRRKGSLEELAEYINAEQACTSTYRPHPCTLAHHHIKNGNVLEVDFVLSDDEKREICEWLEMTAAPDTQPPTEGEAWDKRQRSDSVGGECDDGAPLGLRLKRRRLDASQRLPPTRQRPQTADGTQGGAPVEHDADDGTGATDRAPAALTQPMRSGRDPVQQPHAQRPQQPRAAQPATEVSQGQAVPRLQHEPGDEVRPQDVHAQAQRPATGQVQEQRQEQPRGEAEEQPPQAPARQLPRQPAPARQPLTFAPSPQQQPQTMVQQQPQQQQRIPDRTNAPSAQRQQEQAAQVADVQRQQSEVAQRQGTAAQQVAQVRQPGAYTSEEEAIELSDDDMGGPPVNVPARRAVRAPAGRRSGRWTVAETQELVDAMEAYGTCWSAIAKETQLRDQGTLKDKWRNLVLACKTGWVNVRGLQLPESLRARIKALIDKTGS